MKEENEANGSEFSEKPGGERTGREEVFTKIVRAGNRTYFFDVKATRKNDLYLTITESKKKFNKEGKFFFEKHKIFLYQEDFNKFINGLEDAFDFVTKGEVGEEPVSETKIETDAVVQETDAVVQETDNEDSLKVDEFIDIEFEDLGSK